jgi:multidrug efflux pump subunit AcrA (membrane-fusion protein)
MGTMVFDSYPEENITGKIKEISFSPDKNEAGTVYDVKIELSSFNNDDYKYRLGMTADANFVIKEKRNVLVIPSQYVKADGDGKFVLVGKDKKKTYIKTGIESDMNIEITKGLKEGDVVYD